MTSKKVKLGLILICAIALILYTSNASLWQSEITTFHPDRIRFIDQVGDNLLYRGNVPIIEQRFALADLVSSMLSRTSRKSPLNPEAKALTTLPDRYYLVDFSLLNNFGAEGAASRIEAQYFVDNPTGELIHYQLYKRLFKGIVLRDVGRRYDEVVTDLRQQLLSTSDSPRIIYLHCKAGLDRTGSITAGYAMKYLGYSYKDAMAINLNQGLSRAPDYYSSLGIKHYARYLKDIAGIKTIGDVAD